MASRTIKLCITSASVSKLDSRLETRGELEGTPLGTCPLLVSSMTMRRLTGETPPAVLGVYETRDALETSDRPSRDRV